MGKKQVRSILMVSVAVLATGLTLFQLFSAKDVEKKLRIQKEQELSQKLEELKAKDEEIQALREEMTYESQPIPEENILDRYDRATNTVPGAAGEMAAGFIPGGGTVTALPHFVNDIRHGRPWAAAAVPCVCFHRV